MSQANNFQIKLGGDPVCQQMFMVLLLKLESNSNLQFNVRTTNPLKPHPDYRASGLKQLPGTLFLFFIKCSLFKNRSLAQILPKNHRFLHFKYTSHCTFVQYIKK